MHFLALDFFLVFVGKLHTIGYRQELSLPDTRCLYCKSIHTVQVYPDPEECIRFLLHSRLRGERAVEYIKAVMETFN